MNRLSVAVCEEDRIYAEKLAAWLSEREKDQIICYYFSSTKLFEEFYQKESPDVILFGKKFAEEPWILKEISREEKSSLWIYLEEKSVKRGSEDMGDIPVVEKYQPATSLSRKVFQEYQKYRSADETVYQGEKEIIGWYSPGNTIWQTPLALTMAAVLGRKEKVLYINLKECSGFSVWFQETYEADVVDLIYLAVENPHNFQDKVRSMVYTMECFDYIPPVLDSHLLSEADSKDYVEFLRVMREQTKYDVILLDLGSMLPGFFQILEACSCIYTPVEMDMLAGAPQKHFKEIIKRQGKPELEKKIRWLEQPEMNRELLMPGCLMQQWLWGEPGDYIRRLVEGTGGRD